MYLWLNPFFVQRLDSLCNNVLSMQHNVTPQKLGKIQWDQEGTRV